jgi:hypothetical protein
MYPVARWFYVVSGDSVPLWTSEQLIAGPNSKGMSKIGLRPRMWKNKDGVCCHSHSQWKILSRSDAEALVSDLLPNLDTLRKAWIEDSDEEKGETCLFQRHFLVGCPDEYVIGSFLIQNVWGVGKDLRAHIREAGGSIMGQRWAQENCKCGEGHPGGGHAIAFEDPSDDEFRALLRSSRAKNGIVALRKVCFSWDKRIERITPKNKITP